MYVPNFDLKQPSLGILLNVYIYGKMGVYVSHLVLETPSNANDQVVDNGFDGPKCSDVLARTMMQLDIDEVLRRMGEAHREMGHVLDEFA